MLGGRAPSLVLRSIFEREHYAALLRMRRLYPDPVDFARRYFLGAGGYPYVQPVATPEGEVRPTLRTHHDVFTMHEIFAREDYRAGADLGAVVDLGSNIGLSALYFLTRNRTSRVWCYEPVPANVAALRANLAGFEARYTVEEAAVADRAGTLDFGVEPSGRYGGLGADLETTIRVETREINDVLADVLAQAASIDLLKLDTEGAEVATVAAIAPEHLRRIRTIVLETDERVNPDPSPVLLGTPHDVPAGPAGAARAGMRRPLVDPAPRVVGDSGLLAASLLVAGLSGAAVALLLTLAAGSGERTDAVLAAYSVYVVAALFAATARTSLVPLFGAARPEGEFRARAADVASRMALAGALAGAGLALAAPFVAPLLTGALGARARETALAAVLLFAPCAWLQMRAAAMSALLSAATRFRVSALAYGAAGLCSVAVAAPALSSRARSARRWASSPGPSPSPRPTRATCVRSGCASAAGRDGSASGASGGSPPRWPRRRPSPWPSRRGWPSRWRRWAPSPARSRSTPTPTSSCCSWSPRPPPPPRSPRSRRWWRGSPTAAPGRPAPT